MALVKCKEPIYDKQVELVLKRLEEGLNREEIAQELNYSNPVSLDNYMRRKNFSWDSRSNNFVPAGEKYSAKARDNMLPLRGVSRLNLILNLFEEGEADLRDIAIQAGFSTHKEMVKYMTEKGYEWDTHAQGYKKKKKPHEERTKVGLKEVGNLRETDEEMDATDATKGIESILPYLQTLIQQNLQTSEIGAKGLPRYVVKGSLGTKTVHMVNSLDHLVKNYSKEHNITQREIFEVALIEFFQKYGYSEELDFCLAMNNGGNGGAQSVQ